MVGPIADPFAVSKKVVGSRPRPSSIFMVVGVPLGLSTTAIRSSMLGVVSAVLREIFDISQSLVANQKCDTRRGDHAALPIIYRPRCHRGRVPQPRIPPTVRQVVVRVPIVIPDLHAVPVCPQKYRKLAKDCKSKRPTIGVRHCPRPERVCALNTRLYGGRRRTRT